MAINYRENKEKSEKFRKNGIEARRRKKIQRGKNLMKKKFIEEEKNQLRKF